MIYAELTEMVSHHPVVWCRVYITSRLDMEPEMERKMLQLTQ